jgi:hypothetical protein
MNVALALFSKMKSTLNIVSGPKGIAVDRSGHLVVVDSKQSAVFVFQPGGKLVQVSMLNKTFFIRRYY